METKKLQFKRSEIASQHPITNVKINNGVKSEIVAIADFTGYIDYRIDNKICTKFGDYRKGNLIYQIKSSKCEIKLPKQLNIQCNSFEDILNNYIKYEKANRYIYVIEHNNETYSIIMNKQEFKEFIEKFGTYEHSHNNIRVYKSDNTIWKWVQGC